MIEIKKDIYWTGYVDWNLRNFHGYSTPSGSSYNSYLIIDKKVVLIDTVKEHGFDEMISGIAKIIDPSKIDYIISNHAERDHSGSIDKLLSIANRAKVIVSPQGEKNLKLQFHKDLNFMVIEDGYTLDIGSKNLKFILTPMVHWPDSMITYCGEDKILFSNDAFGQHIASYERFCDELGLDIILNEARKYYANIVMPYGEQVKKVFDKITGFPINMIAPSHGVIWNKKENIEKILNFYAKWANYECDDKAVIVYDSMWGSTKEMAYLIKTALEQESTPVELFDLSISHISDVVAKLLEAKILFLGSAVINNQVMPTVGSFLTYIKGLKPRGTICVPFGSYGWSKVAYKQLENDIIESGMTLGSQGLYCQFVPKKEEMKVAIETILSQLKDVRLVDL